MTYFHSDPFFMITLQVEYALVVVKHSVPIKLCNTHVFQ